MLFRISYIALLSVMAAFLGLGLGYPKILSPLEHNGYFKSISSDRWIENAASVDLPQLFPRGNKAIFHFSKWHPEGLPNPHLVFYVCNQLVSQPVIKPGSSHTVYLTGKCLPRQITIGVLNPFNAGGRDLRELGVQLDYLEITSRLGFPLPDLQSIIVPALAVFIILFLLNFIFQGIWKYLLLLAFAAGSVCLIMNNYFFNQQALTAITIFTTLLLAGMLFARRCQVTTSEFLLHRLSDRIFYCLLACTFFLGACLRFKNIDFGLPFNYHPDEVPKYNAIMRMREAGDLNPRYFLHPTLLLYSTYFFNNLFNWLMPGSSWESTLILSGRIMSASAGCLSVFLTALTGRRLFSNSTGIIASALLAVFPLHVTCSRYVKEDALLVFFILAAVYMVIRAVQSDKPALLLIAGLLAGFSAGVKYSGLVSVMILTAAPFLKSKKFIPDFKYSCWTILAIICVPLGLFISSPYILLDYQTFLHDFNSEKDHMIRGHSAAITAWSEIWMYHYSRSLLQGMQGIALAIATLGAGLLLYRFKIKTLYIIALVLLYYIPAEFVTAKPAPQPERYVMPCLPFLAISAAYFLNELRRYFKFLPLKVIAVFLTFMTIALPLQRSYNLASELRPDTRDIMAEWMLRHIPLGSKVLVDWRPYAPQFEGKPFQLIFLDRANLLEELDPKKLAAYGADYLIMSSLFYDRYFSQPNVPALHREIMRTVWKSFPEVKRIVAEHGTYGFHNPELKLFELKMREL